MAWSTIRKATGADRDALTRAAERFCRRHKINTDDLDGPLQSVDFAIDAEKRDVGTNTLARAWKRIVQRVLGERGCEGIAYGYVGYHAD